MQQMVCVWIFIRSEDELSKTYSGGTRASRRGRSGRALGARTMYDLDPFLMLDGFDAAKVLGADLGLYC